MTQLIAQFEGVAGRTREAKADLLAGTTRAPRSFTESSWDRLLELRRRVDTDGLFASYLSLPDDTTDSEVQHRSAP